MFSWGCDNIKAKNIFILSQTEPWEILVRVAKSRARILYTNTPPDPTSPPLWLRNSFKVPYNRRIILASNQGCINIYVKLQQVRCLRLVISYFLNVSSSMIEKFLFLKIFFKTIWYHIFYALYNRIDKRWNSSARSATLEDKSWALLYLASWNLPDSQFCSESKTEPKCSRHRTKLGGGTPHRKSAYQKEGGDTAHIFWTGCQ